MKLTGKNIGILAAAAFEDLEFWVPHMRMVEEGATVTVIGTKSGVTYKSKSGGLTVKSQAAADELSADQLDALLVPGGWAPDKLRRDAGVLRLVREMNDRQKILGFICHAGWVAASAGICKGKSVTGSTGIKDDMENAGAVWVDEPAFRDGNQVWGRVVEDIPDYCRELVKALS
ncbi:MAG: type 1 glutamine amidotransferase [Desulfobacteraceae bacterium]|nr:type 1 glutamine amidotransferase [Desulfobacteraceae bacterium]